jgi:hypothetical protein
MRKGFISVTVKTVCEFSVSTWEWHESSEQNHLPLLRGQMVPGWDFPKTYSRTRARYDRVDVINRVPGDRRRRLIKGHL